MQLEQQESFEIKGPQLEVFGEAETRLPAAAKKRPAALAVLAGAIVAHIYNFSVPRPARSTPVRSMTTATASSRIFRIRPMPPPASSALHLP